MNPIGTVGFRLSSEDSNDFAELSGDYNPIHLDPLSARRSSFGGTVVHGIHCLLKVFDCWASERQAPFALRSLRADFHGPLPTGSLVQPAANASSGKFTCRVRGAYGVAQIIRANYAEIAAAAVSSSYPLAGKGPSTPLAMEFQQAAGKKGSVPLQLDAALSAKLFPSLWRLMPHAQIAALLASTRIVGMECPGLRSLYVGLDLQFDEVGGASALDYVVEDSDERFQIVIVAIRGAGVRGHVKAMFRPKPVVQEPFLRLQRLVRKEQFRRQRALIVGGSRGLGELTAKIIAAGGGDVSLTYAAGAAEARELMEEITRGGGIARAIQFDILRPPESPPAGPAGVTHLYYFATPHIALNKNPAWDANLFNRFQSFYVEGFERTVRIVRSWWPEGELTVYYPSSVFVEEMEPGAAEYAAAKSAGESLCHYLELANAGLRIRCKRLPRVRTDQTNAPGFDHSTLPDAASVLQDWFLESS
jgi:NAD(P)-dependent dehydrogenase (short-subunit alcohol dehydrogenase family)